MNEVNNINNSGLKPESEPVELAHRILKVYGKVENKVLDKEIKRMAKMLDIPIEEVLPNA